VLRQKDKAGKMPTSKRKMNRKRCKQPKTIDKPYKPPFGVILEHDEKDASAINRVNDLMN